jgi:hypothetical protein
MDAEPGPTTAQRMWVYALHGLYNEPDLSAAERRRGEQIVDENEISLNKKEDFATVASYLLDEYEKWTALETIYRNFERQRRAGGELDEWYFIAVAEFAEVQHLVNANEYGSAILRACSFLEDFLQDEVDWREYTSDEESEISFAQLINWSHEEGIVQRDEQRLLHFVRQVRNEMAHHAWLRNDIPRELALLANRVSLLLIDHLLQYKAEGDGVDVPTFDAGSEFTDELFDTINEHEWWYDEMRQHWHPP